MQKKRLQKNVFQFVDVEEKKRREKEKKENFNEKLFV
jgi:hypothetical protein